MGYKRDLIALGLVAVLVVLQFFIIRYGVLGNRTPDPDEMSDADKVSYAQKNDMIMSSEDADDVMDRAGLSFAVCGLSEPEDADGSFEDTYGRSFKDVEDAGLGGAENEAIYRSLVEKVMYPASEKKFAPEKEVTTEDFIMALDRKIRQQRVTLTEPEEAPPAVSDIDAAHDYAQKTIKRFEKYGLLKGAGTKIKPTKPITIGKAADILIRTKNAIDADRKKEGKEYKPLPELAGLEKAFNKEVKDKEGTWSLYVKCLDTGETLTVNSKQMVSASLIKLFVAGTYFDQVKKGKLEETYASKDHLDLMISESSNTSWVDLETIIGGSEQEGVNMVNNFIRENGYDDTGRLITPSSTGERANYTSVKDVGEVIDKIYMGTYISKDASKVILGHMLDQTHKNKIPAGLPDGVKSANKTGELATNEHDSGIVWTDRCVYEIVIMSEGVNISSVGYKEVANVSKLVYEYMTK